ncbi:MAG: hypothetical protein IIX28_04850 [Clostridia bacterium]|nr:hypothetical protein [Clostridia bacterium]
MKKEERLHRLLGEIDDDLVADAARKPIRKAVWVPAVAAAACVALTVGLWQGGVFDPAEIPVETPDESTTTTAEPTEPYILVGGEEDSDSMQDEASNHRPISSALKEKIQEYRDVNAVFQVVVFSGYTVEDDDDFDVFIDTNEEYQSLLKRYKEAKKAKNKASDRLHQSIVNNDDPEIQAALTEEFLKAREIFDDLSHKSHILREELWKKHHDTLEKERISYAAKYSKIEPIYGYGRFGNGYYMELTADAINELSNRGGYIFKLAGEKENLDQMIED